MKKETISYKRGRILFKRRYSAGLSVLRLKLFIKIEVKGILDNSNAVVTTTAIELKSIPLG